MKYVRIDLDSPSEWEDALNGITHSFCHRWEYCKAMSISSGLITCLHMFENDGGKAMVALSERHKEIGISDLVSPYGFGGFTGDPEFLVSKKFRDAFIDFGLSTGHITAYILQNPLLELPRLYWKDYLDCSHQVYKIDLTMDIASLWSAMSKTHRYEIKRFDREEGFRLIFDHSLLAPAVKSLYRETLRRVEASDVYNFPVNTLDILMDSSKALLIGVEGKEGIQAVSLFLHTEFIAEYFINATTLHGRKYSRRILWQAIETLKNMKVPSLNLGGGVKPGDSLDDFKRRFGGKAIGGQALKIIFNQDAYNALTEKYCDGNQQTAGYFPPYWSKDAKYAKV
jgi:hypothetical protein